MHLFCFSFHVGECKLVFTLNTRANKDIHLHQYETRVYDFWPQLLLLKYTIKWFQVLQCNSNNLTSVICSHKCK